MKNSLIYFAVLLCTIPSCKEKPKEANLLEGKESVAVIETTHFGSWKFSHQEPSDGSRKEHFISFFPDGKGTIIAGVDLDTFVWVKDQNRLGEISIRPELGLIGYGSGNSSQVRLMTHEGKSYIELSAYDGNLKLYFSRRYNMMTNYLEDPYHPDNNLWRIRAYKEITTEQIESKVNNYLLHYKYLFKVALDEEGKRRFTNKNSKGIIRIYDGGIGVVSPQKISEDWYSYYYTKEEALASLDILKKKIKDRNIAKKRSDDWVLAGYKVLERITGE